MIVSERSEILSHCRAIVRVILGRISILPLVLITELTAELQRGEVTAEMIVNSHRGASLQIELRGRSTRKINRIERVLRRIEDGVSCNIAAVLWPILAWARLIF